MLGAAHGIPVLLRYAQGRLADAGQGRGVWHTLGTRTWLLDCCAASFWLPFLLKIGIELL